MNKKICIVTTRHISYNPRVLKEADALSAAGYAVTVVTVNNHAAQRRFDEELMKTRRWELKTVNFRKDEPAERVRWMRLSLRQKVYSKLAGFSFAFGIAERAAEKAFDGLVRLAVAEKADLYIAHHAEALGAAYRAAKRHGALFGFDEEDFHTGMNDQGSALPAVRMIEYLERKYLPSAVYLSAAAKGFAVEYSKKYGIREAVVILNAFPYEELPVRPVNDPVRFYWYSQVIGPNRGLEMLMQAASRIGDSLSFEIHLRGRLYSEDFGQQLKRIWPQVQFHEPILVQDIIADANRFDVGLAMETDSSVNANLAVANKIFSYLISRLYIIGTNTAGQQDIFGHFPDAVGMFRMHDVDDLVRVMQAVILDRDLLLEGKRAAGKAAALYNWEKESEKLIANVNSAFIS